MAPLKILVVDDERSQLLTLEHQLKKLGYDVISARDGAEALEVFRSQSAAIIVSDWMMPRMTGVELCQAVRKVATNSYTYFILLTGKDDRESLIEGLEAGADDFQTKPVDFEELRVRLRVGERIIALEEQLATRIDKMKRDLQAAARIQSSLLPLALPEVEGLEVEWRYQPCEELAGDNLNIFKLDEKHLAIYLLDVSGHGVASSLMSVMLSRTLSPNPGQSVLVEGSFHELTPTEINQPFDVLEQLNNSFQISEASGGQYFTIFYGVLNIETWELTYAQAGHPPALYLNGSESKPLTGGGLPIGFVEDPGYTEATIQLDPGDRLVVYSDGIVEAMNARNEQFGLSRVCDLAESHRTKSLEDLCDSIIENIGEWIGEDRHSDDVSLIALGRKA